MMLKIIAVLAWLVFMVLVCMQVSKGRLLLRYSLLWLTLALATIIVSLFPDPVFALARLVGFDVPSNFLFFMALFFLLAVCLSLSVVVSKQAMRMKNLVQNQALLEKRLNDISDTSRDKTAIAGLED